MFLAISADDPLLGEYASLRSPGAVMRRLPDEPYPTGDADVRGDSMRAGGNGGHAAAGSTEQERYGGYNGPDGSGGCGSGTDASRGPARGGAGGDGVGGDGGGGGGYGAGRLAQVESRGSSLNGSSYPSLHLSSEGGAPAGVHPAPRTRLPVFYAFIW